jgi:hypothetical protein
VALNRHTGQRNRVDNTETNPWIYGLIVFDKNIANKQYGMKSVFRITLGELNFSTQIIKSDSCLYHTQNVT